MPAEPERHRDGDTQLGFCPVPEDGDPTTEASLYTQALQGSRSGSEVE